MKKRQLVVNNVDIPTTMTTLKTLYHCIICTLDTCKEASDWSPCWVVASQVWKGISDWSPCWVVACQVWKGISDWSSGRVVAEGSAATVGQVSVNPCAELTHSGVHAECVRLKMRKLKKIKGLSKYLWSDLSYRQFDIFTTSPSK